MSSLPICFTVSRSSYPLSRKDSAYRSISRNCGGLYNFKGTGTETIFTLNFVLGFNTKLLKTWFSQAIDGCNCNAIWVSNFYQKIFCWFCILALFANPILHLSPVWEAPFCKKVKIVVPWYVRFNSCCFHIQRKHIYFFIEDGKDFRATWFWACLTSNIIKICSIKFGLQWAIWTKPAINVHKDHNQRDL